MLRGTPVKTAHAFLKNVNCNTGKCGDASLAAFLHDATAPFLMVEIESNSKSMAISRIVGVEFHAFLQPIRISEALQQLEAAGVDPQIVRDVIRGSSAESPEALKVQAAVKTLRQQLASGAAWVETDERTAALFWLDAATARRDIPPTAQAGSAQAAQPGEHLKAVAAQSRDVALLISERLTKLRARLTWTSSLEPTRSR